MFDKIDWVDAGRSLGVPTVLAMIVLAMVHYDFAQPMQKSLERSADFQGKAVERLTGIETHQKNMEFDLRYGTWRSTEAPRPETVRELPAPSTIRDDGK